MKRLLFLVIVALLGFYVAWPAWTGYQIQAAIQAKDSATLDRKIDFPGVRQSLRPAAGVKVAELFDRYQQKAGPTGALIAGQVKQEVTAKIVETALATLVTPDNLIRVANDGAKLKDSVERLLTEQIGRVGSIPGLGGAPGAGPRAGGGPSAGIPSLGQLGEIAGKMGLEPGKIMGGLGGPKKEEPKAQPAPVGGAASEPSYGLANIKRFSFLGPLAFEIGVAKDAAAAEPDVVTEMRFVGTDWKVTSVKPRL